ncbi:hypothetical protein VTJ83DRAFT_2281 [Remersonia thermophila]|uniref:KAR9-domain-containing protein n=1 Tax=Remersonia thermophila TaxID=72144 RepID=A0ABR4DIB1_9PEZI
MSAPAAVAAPAGSGPDADLPAAFRAASEQASPVAPLVVSVADAEHATATRSDADPNGAANIILTFADVPHEVMQLSDSISLDSSQAAQPPPEEPQQQQQHEQSKLSHAIGSLLHVSNPEPQREQAAQQALLHQDQQHPQPPATTPTAKPAPRVRKPSPGLAARLKALGFGTRKSASPPPSHHLEPGRLPEEQLRRIEEGHLASSSQPVVERRGRPWKGAIARIPSRSSLRSSKSQTRPDSDELAPAPTLVPSTPELLPEITTSEPLEMDTHKYRLPEHVNGNGVKAQPGTREEHISRDTRPPPPPPLTPEIPPPPLPKDSPPMARRPVPNLTTPTASGHARDASWDGPSIPFNPLGLPRPPSIYTLSRASFANQLAQLTSIQLPDAESLSSKVSAIPTAQAATKALIGAAEQIRGWIYKASEVIYGLDSEDDVEWAAAGGREGVDDVEKAIIRFEELINIYVTAIEALQARGDIAAVSADDLRHAVTQMEAILAEWAKMRKALQNVKTQVEIAMEWEELWNNVLGDIQNEMDELARLVFEMEERRHKSLQLDPTSATDADGAGARDLDGIITAADENTARVVPRLHPAGTNSRFSLPPLPVSPTSPSPTTSQAPISQDDQSLLALFARMQPLRASLDFLPMRLSVFEARADTIFPTACEELETRRAELDSSYRKLERDAEALRKELGEDRWVLVFRGAGRQAQKMIESVERAIARLREGIDSGMHLTNQPAMGKKLENYEAKKTHYGPAIERVLAIVDKGVKDRLTVNGEILRLHAEMQGRWAELQKAMANTDAAIEELHNDRREQQLRDSVSSMLSNDMSSTTPSGHETPQSSPPSSVIMSSAGPASSATHLQAPPKQRAASALGHVSTPSSTRRQSLLPTPKTQITRKPVANTARMSTLSIPSTREGSVTPSAASKTPRSSTTSVASRPKWNPSTNLNDIDTGHNFKPLTLTTPSPYAKKPPVPSRSSSSLGSYSTLRLPTLRTPFSRAASASPLPEETPTKHLSFRERLSSPGLSLSSSQRSLGKPPRLATHSSAPPPAFYNNPSNSSLSSSTSTTTANRRASLQPPQRPSADSLSVDAPYRRPASSLSSSTPISSRRASMLPQSRVASGGTAAGAGTKGSSITGRESPQAVAGARAAMRRGSSNVTATGDRKEKPVWRY